MKIKFVKKYYIRSKKYNYVRSKTNDDNIFVKNLKDSIKNIIKLLNNTKCKPSDLI